jgi:hypothetical protein
MRAEEGELRIAGGGGRIAGGEGAVTRLVRRSHDDGTLTRTAGGLDGACVGCACYGQGLRHHRRRNAFPSAGATSPLHGICSMKCLTGVTLPYERGGDSIQQNQLTKPPTLSQV